MSQEKRSPGPSALMYSLEDECGHNISCPSSKLYRGCGQLLNKFKSCKRTQTKCACQETCITITTGHHCAVRKTGAKCGRALQVTQTIYASSVVLPAVQVRTISLLNHSRFVCTSLQRIKLN